jgi:hypothetical protein
LVTVVPNLFATGWPRSARSKAAPNCLHLRDSRIAGSHYYDCHLRAGDSLRLRRQSKNPRDERAIEVFWHEHKLDYLPRLDNTAAASLVDRAHALTAEILTVENPDEAWELICLRVWALIDIRNPNGL